MKKKLDVCTLCTTYLNSACAVAPVNRDLLKISNTMTYLRVLSRITCFCWLPFPSLSKILGLLEKRWHRSEQSINVFFSFHPKAFFLPMFICGFRIRISLTPCSHVLNVKMCKRSSPYLVSSDANMLSVG